MIKNILIRGACLGAGLGLVALVIALPYIVREKKN